jgi:DNA-binding PadR family transcriptional regulator
MTKPTLAVLAVLAAAGGGPVHGWHVKEETGLGGATVYKILAELTAGGYLTARWEELPAGAINGLARPRRRFYTLTDAGTAMITATLAAAVRRAAHPKRKAPR